MEKVIQERAETCKCPDPAPPTLEDLQAEVKLLFEQMEKHTEATMAIGDFLDQLREGAMDPSGSEGIDGKLIKGTDVAFGPYEANDEGITAVHRLKNIFHLGIEPGNVSEGISQGAVFHHRSMAVTLVVNYEGFAELLSMENASSMALVHAESNVGLIFKMPSEILPRFQVSGDEGHAEVTVIFGDWQAVKVIR